MTGMASAPGSSGNLGPGFDMLALALDLRCVVTAEPSDRWVIHEEGNSFTPGNGDLVVRAVAAAVDRPMRLEIDNAIPRSRGLGSSAAVTAAAACASIRAVGRDPRHGEIFDLVTDLEGHSDNAAASVYGGFVLARGSEWRSLPLADSVRFVLAVPEGRLSTDVARAALPAAVDLDAASRNLGRLAMLLEGLRTGDPEALRLAGGDELHENHRAHLSPITGVLMEAAIAAGGYHAAWSGAGPAAIVVTDDEHIDDVIEALAKTLDGTGETLVLDVAADGLR